MKRAETIEVLKRQFTWMNGTNYDEEAIIEIAETLATKLQAKEVSDEEIIASIPYPEAISKHQTDINIGWIRCRKWMRDKIKQL